MPRTEAGKRWMQTPAAQVVTGMADAIQAIEDEAEHRGYLRANDCDHSPCIEREAEAIATRRAALDVIALDSTDPTSAMRARAGLAAAREVTG